MSPIPRDPFSPTALPCYRQAWFFPFEFEVPLEQRWSFHLFLHSFAHLLIHSFIHSFSYCGDIKKMSIQPS